MFSFRIIRKFGAVLSQKPAPLVHQILSAGQTTPADFTLKKKEVSKPGFIPGIGIIGTSLALLGAALTIWKKRKTEE